MNTGMVVHKPAAVALALASAPAPLQPFIQAFQSKRVKEASPIEVRKAISEGLAVANYNMGRKLPDPSDKLGTEAYDKENEFFIEQIVPDVCTLFSTMHVQEIILAFNRGSKGMYGENFGLSPATVFRWLQNFIGDHKRLEAKKELTKPVIASEPAKVISREDRIAFATAAFERFKAQGQYQDYGNVVYNFLDSEKLIPFTTAEKNAIMNEVRSVEHARLSQPVTKDEQLRFNRELLQMMESDESIIPKAKRAALNKFFKLLQDQGKPLSFTQEHVKCA